MVNKQYKIQHIIDNNNCKSLKPATTTKTTTPINYKTQYFGEPKTFLNTSDNTPSFTSYESIGTINSSLIENSLIVPKPKRSSLNLPIASPTKSRFSNSFEDNYNRSSLTNPSSSLESSIYGRNIKMSYSGTGNNSKDRKNQKFLRGQQTNQSESSDLTINDIGRFQYILQMDKELGTYPESYYHLSSKNHQHQNSLNGSDLKSLSLNSSNGQHFWKAGSDYPIETTPPSTSISSSMSSKPLQFRNRASEMFYWQKHDLMEHSRAFWSYTKWPIILLLSCLVLSSLIFLLFLMSTTNTTRNSSTQQLKNSFDDHMMSANFSEERISLPDFDEMDKDDDQQSLYNDFNFNDKYNNKNDDDLIHTYGSDKNDRDEIVTIYMKSPNNLQSNEDNKMKITKTPPSKIFVQEIDFELETGDNDNNNHDEKLEEKIKIIQQQSGSTTRNPLIRNTQIMKFTTHKGFKADDEILVKSTTEKLDIEKDEDMGVLPPTKETLQVIGFTSGHQNNFGVPIEEDERILRLLNEEIIKYESQENSTTERTSTTTVKVSPTLPLIMHHKDTSPSRYRTTTESMMSMLNSTEVCESTSLDLCQGVLWYDLTTAKSKRNLESMDFEHFKFLISSNCSNRAAEFICSVLEPECRSAKLGSLQPCKRICKSILEPCAGLISSSAILTMTFDCDRYPDSSDRNVCEDPTRRGNNCYDNEFQCLDSTCVPKQWKCDNIKDCPLGEDEENCQFCHHDEFQCQSDGKCIPENWHCDSDNDCHDASDEIDCDAYDELNDEFNDEDNIDKENENIDYESRLYNLFSDQIQNTSDNTNNLPNELSFLAISPKNEDSNTENLKYNSNNGLFGTDTINNIQSKVNLTTNSSNSNEEQDEEIQTGEASGRIIVGVPHNQEKNHFQDSTEIMMTSDTENDFKYSKIIRGNNRSRNGITTSSNKRITSSSSTTVPTTLSKRTTTSSITGSTRNSLRLTTLSRRGSSTITSTTTTSEPISTKLLRTSSSSISRKTTLPTTTPKDHLQDHSTLCPGAQLRCVSGKCITVDQLCDRIIDCPDGADEARCVFKDNDEAN